MHNSTTPRHLEDPVKIKRSLLEQMKAAALTEYNARMAEVNRTPVLSGPGAVSQYDSHAVPTHPEGGNDECPDGCGGFIVPTGDLDPRGVSHVCSELCGWSA